ncbi:Ras family guanine nucleotide exchange factor CDC25 [Sugiyamaella lignohabitans]|uniref:Ras family guanine nucleotide exchange factor CDC25 n=1 Tax=Sugiyamaella lignohabitans TaxID=796027 RepID=A0A167FHQ4_9ASCO|nr:Ras family guanine nucleotide exchange factor CDC25 [Sugiyamaella lignohabitans]ANB15313.1 Ras family guanine nucleotide exchange factor CDC25 [Sugiyamaella lignohabitans]
MINVSTPPLEESFDFSTNEGYKRDENQSLRRQSSIAAMSASENSSSPRQMVGNFANTNAQRISRALKFPVHRKSFNFRQALSPNTNYTTSATTPPDSPILGRNEFLPQSETAITGIDSPALEKVSKSVSDKTPTLEDQPTPKVGGYDSLTSQVAALSIAPASLRPLSLRPLSILQEDDIQAPGASAKRTSSTPAGIVHEDDDSTSDVDDEYEDAHQSSSAASSMSVDFPFLRAIHSFQSTSLSRPDNSSTEPDPATICLSFEESDIALLHSVHASGWGDATLLSTGQRGWIPTNYFSPYAETKVIPLLSAILNFVVSPKSYPLRMDPAASDKNNDKVELSPVFTFSQASITNIITGVRSLLEACGTLTRDTPVVRRSQSIRKFRKSLLTELAILVSLAKQYRNTTDDVVIDKLVVVCYKIVTKAVMFLDVWVVDVNLNEEDRISGNFDEPTSVSTGSTATAVVAPAALTTSSSFTANRRNTASENRVSVVFHSQPPFANQRLDEVNEALTTYLGIFIHRMTVLDSDPSAATQLLINTRKSMLACRELLATVESISSKSLPRNRDLENSKDKLFIRIRTLVTVAREVVCDTNSETKSTSTESLIQNATGCAQTACECVVRCRNILSRIGDFQLPSNREYPDFTDTRSTPQYRGREVHSVISVESEAPASSVAASYSSATMVSSPTKSVLPDIPALSPIVSRESRVSASNTELDDLDGHRNLDVVEDDNGKIRAASLESLIILLTDEGIQQDPFLVSTFFLTFRLFTSARDVFDILLKRYEVNTNEIGLPLKRVEDLSSRRVKIFNFMKRWMESHWKPSDNVILDDVVVLSENHFKNILPNANLIITHLATKLSYGESEPIIPRQIALPAGNQYSAMISATASSVSMVSRTLPKHQVNLLNKANESNGFIGDDLGLANDDDLKSTVSNSTWTSSLRVRHSLAGAGSLVNYHMNGSMATNNGTHFVTILDFDPADIANQLTIMDSSVFCKVKPEELLDQNFTKKKRELGLSPNVSKMTAMSNQLSAFVGDSILGGDIPAKSRRNLLKQWIKIAEKCFELRNFNSLLSIISALQSVNIMRLKRIWELLPLKYNTSFQNLKKLLIPDKNFAYYRSKLKDQSPPCIPYLGLYLSDLIFIEEGNAKTRPLPSGTEGINLDRYERLTKLIGGLQQFQVSYRLTSSRELQTWLRGEMTKSHQAVTRDLNGLWRRSCLVEPKN